MNDEKKKTQNEAEKSFVKTKIMYKAKKSKFLLKPHTKNVFISRRFSISLDINPMRRESRSIKLKRKRQSRNAVRTANQLIFQDKQGILNDFHVHNSKPVRCTLKR